MKYTVDASGSIHQEKRNILQENGDSKKNFMIWAMKTLNAEGFKYFCCWSWEKGTLIFSVVVVKIKKPSDLCCKKLNLTVKYKKYCRNRGTRETSTSALPLLPFWILRLKQE